MPTCRPDAFTPPGSSRGWSPIPRRLRRRYRPHWLPHDRERTRAVSNRRLIVMQTRCSFGGDENIFAEVGEAMSLEAFFKSLFVTNAVRDARIKGVTEICPANASYQVKFDPDQIKPDDLLSELKQLDAG